MTFQPPQLAVPAISTAEIAAAAKALGAAGGSSGTAKLLALLYDEDVDVDRVLRCLNTEPTLAARVLKVANSAYYKRAGTVGTVDRALQMLGLSAIRVIAAAGCMDRMPVPALGKGVDARAFRRHSLAVAAAAQALSQRARSGVDAEAFMAGLLHDIGHVMLARLRPEAVLAVADLPVIDSVAGLLAETVLIGADHSNCAALLAEAWGLPGWLGAALRTHHAPPAAARVTGTDALPVLLALGDRAALAAGFGLWPVCATAADPAWAASLDLDEAACAEVAAGLAETLHRLAPGH